MASPSRPGRTGRRAALAVAAAAVLAAGGVWLYPDLARRGDFTSDPPPCSLVTAQTARAGGGAGGGGGGRVGLHLGRTPAVTRSRSWRCG
ncbi:hypothetical protein [Streptomyces sp. C]|uniref:hypothetical protein n=1 Tax=Streptomyces sp. C TaxID=253839 RepID=UPI0001B56DAE|nr:hypothetical protein [Streptomyces sp. C]EFL19263.1 predicted protein [Streptomyces sp. C]